MKKNLRTASSILVCLGLLGACGGSDGGTDPPDTTADSAVADTTTTTDGTLTETTTPTDAVVEEDIAQASGPLANVYLQSPVEDETVSQVELPDLTDEDGFLKGTYANVDNCINESGGAFFFLCNMRPTVQPGADGSYLHIGPSSDSDPNDAFAEVMMYYHMMVAHAYFTETLGMAPLTEPLYGLVNVQFNYGGWQPMDNAAFMPKETLAQFQMSNIESDAIVFGQGVAIDYAYDADVIRHEYTHAVVGATRLSGMTWDSYGIDDAPGAMNEAHADYFSATMSGDPVIGSYALSNAGGMDMSRDLSALKTCPADYIGEVHADGEIYGSALWAVREAIGAELADQIIFDALQGFVQTTTFATAAQATIERAAQEGPEIAAAVQKAFEDRGLIACERVKDYQDFNMGFGELPIMLEGTQSTGVLAFNSFTPGFLQYRLEVPEGTLGILVDLTAPEQQGWGGGGGDQNLGLAIRNGEVIQYDYGNGFALTEADAVLDLAKTANAKYGTTLSGSCLTPGTHYIQLHNRNGGQAQVTYMKISFLTEDPTAGNYDCSP
jgi:hypothetical protein